jgi:hypothetical protein
MPRSSHICSIVAKVSSAACAGPVASARPGFPLELLGLLVVIAFGSQPFEVLGGPPVRLLDVFLELGSLDPPLVTPTDLDSIQITGSHKAVNLPLGAPKQVSYLPQRQESRLARLVAHNLILPIGRAGGCRCVLFTWTLRPGPVIADLCEVGLNDRPAACSTQSFGFRQKRGIADRSAVAARVRDRGVIRWELRRVATAQATSIRPSEKRTCQFSLASAGSTTICW